MKARSRNAGARLYSPQQKKKQPAKFKKHGRSDASSTGSTPSKNFMVRGGGIRTTMYGNRASAIMRKIPDLEKSTSGLQGVPENGSSKRPKKSSNGASGGEHKGRRTSHEESRRNKVNGGSPGKPNKASLSPRSKKKQRAERIHFPSVGDSSQSESHKKTKLLDDDGILICETNEDGRESRESMSSGSDLDDDTLQHRQSLSTDPAGRRHLRRTSQTNISLGTNRRKNSLCTKPCQICGWINTVPAKWELRINCKCEQCSGMLYDEETRAERYGAKCKLAVMQLAWIFVFKLKIALKRRRARDPIGTKQKKMEAAVDDMF